MNDLTPRRLGGSPSRGLQRATAQLVEQTQLAGTQLDALAALGGRTMERAMQLYDHGMALAGSDPARQAIVMEVELRFIGLAGTHLNNFARKLD